MNYVQDAFTVQVGRITNGAFLPLLELPRTFRFFIHVLSSHSNRTKRVICGIICLFVWCFSSHARNFHSYGYVTIAGYLCSALMSIEHWGFFKVPQLLWHGASVYNGHPEGPVTLTHIAERLAAELSLPVFYAFGLSQLGFEHPTFHIWGERSNQLRHRCGSVTLRRKAIIQYHVALSKILTSSHILTKNRGSAHWDAIFILLYVTHSPALMDDLNIYRHLAFWQHYIDNPHCQC